ncbi:MAG TPA: hypothetical protein DCP69_12985 [Candidatus Omnitrophica bacterium]|nr:hypothetical protein [Candidatus Omnitrophota bacterium]
MANPINQDELILYDRTAAAALADWLVDRRAERPEPIAPERWRQFLCAESRHVTWDELREMVDCLSPRVLDVLRFPKTRAER